MLRVCGAKGCGLCEVTKLFLRSRHVPLEFIDVATQPDKRSEKEKLGSLTSGVILEDISEDSGDIVVTPGVSVAKLNYLKEYRVRHAT